jgi:hypothetical protein
MLKSEYNTKDYLSCEIKFNKNRKMAWIGQTHQVKKLEDLFGELVKGCQKYKTPGTPNFGIVQPKKDDPRVIDKEQSTFRSVVASLLHLMKHSQPNISNAVRELSKCMDGATCGVQGMRVIKFVINTNDYGLRISPSVPKMKKWKLEAYTNSYWAGDKGDRIASLAIRFYQWCRSPVEIEVAKPISIVKCGGGILCFMRSGKTCEIHSYGVEIDWY